LNPNLPRINANLYFEENEMIKGFFLKTSHIYKMKTVSQTYIPTSNSPQLVIQGLNDLLGSETAIPGNWSSTIFFQDLKAFPVKTKKQLAEAVLDACRKNTSYLDFFEITRETRRECTEYQEQLWTIFNEGSIMLYFEPFFLRLINNEVSGKEVLILYLNALSTSLIAQWDEILKGIGACCYQWFVKEPELYADLPYRKNKDSPENMTDFELFEAIESSLSPTSYRGKVSVEDSRTKLIEKYKIILLG
jgi:hypothetical protein